MKHLWPKTILALLMFFCLSAKAQFYTTGDDPLSIRYRRATEGNRNIIFDQNMRPWAIRLSHKLDSIIPIDCLSLQHTPRSIDILLHSSKAYSNGLVTWAPSHLEMYTYPQADGDCIPWMTHLAVHEYRHVVQTSSLNRGFTRFLYCLFGEQAIGAVLGLEVPLWFLEGDAVTMETALTQGGRGRQASFIQQMRTQVLNGRTPSYDQAYNGSYARRLPDYYHMGYLTVSNARAKFGSQIWANALKKVGRKSITITPFNRSLKHDTDRNRVGLYYDAMSDWHSRWLHEDSLISPTPFTTLIGPSGDYTELTSPQFFNNSLVAFKTDPDELSSISSSNSSLTVTSPRQEDGISAHGDTVVWCELHNHPRWDNAGTGALMMLDNNGNRHTIINNLMLSTPVISPDGKCIAAVSTLKNGHQEIITVDFNGNNLSTTPLLPFEQATHLCFQGSNICFISLTDCGKAIILLNADGSRKIIRQYAFENLRHLTSSGNNLYFTSDITGIENIYVINTDGQEERITSSRYGAAWPTVKGDSLIYSEYSPTGYSIVCTPITTRATDHPVSTMHQMAKIISEQEHNLNKDINISSSSDTTSFTDKRYLRLAHPLLIHSWGPIVVDADDNTASAGIAISSQNTLGNSILSGGINWGKTTDERFFLKYSYTALYPKFDLSAKWGYYKQQFSGYQIAEERNADDETGDTYYAKYYVYKYNFKQHMMHLTLNSYIPLSITRGAYIYGIRPSVLTDYYRSTYLPYERSTIIVDGHKKSNESYSSYIPGSKYTNLRYSLHAYWLKRMSSRDVGYRLGLSLEGGYTHTLYGDDHGKARYATASLYLPGIGRHHSINIQYQWQDKLLGSTQLLIDGGEYNYLMGDYIGLARGTSRLRNKGANLLRVNYTLPVANPDFSMGPVCYVKRINARLFYDYSEVKWTPYTYEHTPFNKTFNSVGLEAWMESHWFRLPYSIRIGYRGAIINGSTTSNEMIFGVTIK